jgi:acyl-CoA synthetase (AMP-forming)/AMP-acid ligase II
MQQQDKVYRTELTPLSFLRRSAYVFPEKIAIVHGERRYTYREFEERVNRLASRLRGAGLRKGDRVAFLAPNIPALLEAHFAVPAAGCVLVPINTRLTLGEVAHVVKHSSARMLFVDADLQNLVQAIDGAGVERVRIDDTGRPGDPYEDYLASGSPEAPPLLLEDEEETIAVNYTSGTTGSPKGAMYSHRGAESYGPTSICAWHEEWTDLSVEGQAQMLARQGQAHVTSHLVRVVDKNLTDVPRDGRTLGEIVIRGNTVMKGYLDDEEATSEAFQGGWYHSGDLAAWHPDGYIEIRDRSKDVIISGGENISSIEVEQTVDQHPAVLEVAVVAIPDAQWGERPKAFVALRPGQTATEEEIIEFCKSRIARYKAPAAVEILDQLPKTSTGKVQKFLLRDKEWAGHDKRVG